MMRFGKSQRMPDELRSDPPEPERNASMSSLLNLSGKTELVTGASRGINAAVARRFAYPG
jgi:hypothetical protein